MILETGLGGSTVGWGFVQPEVARFTRVCSYDRAGMGYSDPGPSPRTARRIARELEQLLDRSGIAGPVVLVGASLGGFTVRLFASERAERVAGLVLVDASHEDQAHEIPRLAPFVPLLSSVGVLRLLGVSFGQTPDSLAPSVRGFARATSSVPPDTRRPRTKSSISGRVPQRSEALAVKLTIPLVVVTGARGADETWRQLQRDQVGLSQRGCQMIADQSGHVVPLEQPEVVVEAIRAIVDAARGRNDVPLTRCL